MDPQGINRGRSIESDLARSSYLTATTNRMKPFLLFPLLVVGLPAAAQHRKLQVQVYLAAGTCREPRLSWTDKAGNVTVSETGTRTGPSWGLGLDLCKPVGRHWNLAADLGLSAKGVFVTHKYYVSQNNTSTDAGPVSTPLNFAELVLFAERELPLGTSAKSVVLGAGPFFGLRLSPLLQLIQRVDGNDAGVALSAGLGLGGLSPRLELRQGMHPLRNNSDATIRTQTFRLKISYALRFNSGRTSKGKAPSRP